MNDTMLGLFSFAALLTVGVILFMGAGVIGFVLWALWRLVKQRNSPSARPPVQTSSSPAPPPSRTCPRCGAPLPADPPQGLCPRCVLGVGMATQIGRASCREGA